MLQERRKTFLGKTTGALAILMGTDLLLIPAFSSNALTQLQTLTKGTVTNNDFLALIVLGGVCAIITGVSLMKYKHFQTITFSVGCGFAVFFGVTLTLLRATQLSNLLMIGSNAWVVGAILLSATVMFLSIYPRKI